MFIAQGNQLQIKTLMIQTRLNCALETKAVGVLTVQLYILCCSFKLNA